MADELLLTITAAAERLKVSYSTVVRLLDDPDGLQCVRQRSRRKANSRQVAYVVAAIEAGRSGSIESFAAEWRAAQEQKVSA